MRLVTFVPKKGAAPRVGVVRDGDQVVDLTQGKGSLGRVSEAVGHVLEFSAPGELERESACLER
jgi:hypothetical protein